MFRKTILLIFGLALAMSASSSLHAVQTARPDSTGATGTFTAVGAATHHDALNELVGDATADGSYVDSGIGNNSSITVGLSAVFDPGAGNRANNHIIRYRCQSVGSKKGEGCDVELLHGGSPIASLSSNANRGAFAEITYTIPDASGITDYSALALRFTSSSLDIDESIQVSWAALEIPDAAATAPTVINPAYANVTDSTADLSGRVDLDGGATVTSRGVKWGIDLNGPYPNSVPDATGGLGDFTVAVSGLPADTDIYFRAWAINAGGEGVSGELSFRTDPPPLAPTVDSPTYESVTATTAVLGGRVFSDGGGTITQRGTVWGLSADPDIVTQAANVNAVAGTTGVFTGPVTGLPPNTLIHFRAFATNSTDTSYSDNTTFPTLIAVPILGDPTVSNIAETSANLGGEVTDTGGGTVSACGVYWDTASPPEAAGTQVPMSPCDAPFSQNVTGLPNEVLVYYRAYATNEAGTAYSTVDNFTPSVPKTPPVIDATPTVTNITHQSADLGGNVTSAGGLPIERGTVWNEAGNPGIGDNKLAEGGTTAGAFSHTRTLPPGKNIYFKAYAINSQGTVLSDQLMFPTETEPTVQATNVSFSNTSARGMRIRWNRGNGEGSIVVVRETGTSKVDPVDGTSYAANHILPDATEIGSSGNFVVYVGANTYVNVGLMAINTSYDVAVYEYTSSSGTWDYLQTNPTYPDPAQGTNSTTNQPVHNRDVGAECGDCHDAHFVFMPTDAEQKTVCETCHNPSGDASAKLEFDLHLTPNRNPDLDYVDCGFCHELHNHVEENTTYSWNAITSSWDYNKSYLRTNVGKYVTTATDELALLDDGAFLHNDTYDAADSANALTPERAVEGGSDTTARGYCQVCHTYTKYHRSDFTTVADRPNLGDPLPNQCHDGEGGTGGPGACDSGNPEIHCGRCHQHNNKFIGVGGSQTCVECHSSGAGSRPTITTQFDRLSTHISSGSTAVTQPDCQVCHDGAHPGRVSVLDADDGVTVYIQPNAVSPLNSGEGEAFAPHCLSCHDSDGAQALVGGDPDQTPSSPFIGSGAPPVIDDLAWAAAAHNRPWNNGTEPSPVTCVGDGTNGCHSSGHGSEKLNLLGPNPETAASSPAFSEQKEGQCLNCHDGSVATNTANLRDIFPDPYTPGYRTTQNNALINQRHDVLYEDQQYSGMVVTCTDCHMPHVDSSSDPVSDPDDGLPLNTYGIGNSYNEDGHNFAYTSGGTDLDPLNAPGAVGGPYSEPDYIQFCLTCHDGTTPPGVVLVQDPPTRRTMVNIADAYGTSDYHGAIAQAGFGTSINKGSMKQPWVTAADEAAGLDPTAPFAAMNCSTCHDAHGSANIFNLKSSINIGGMDLTVGGDGNLNEAHYNGSTTYTLPEIGGTQDDHYWGAWCTFCHQMNAHPGKVETDSCQGPHMHGGGSF
jgi:predicted CXXCH cytochrome family protein